MTAYNSNTNSRKINTKEAEKQLTLLGYTPTENIYIRAFFPSPSANETGRKANKLNWEEIETWHREGRGIYLVVNGGGHKDADVLTGRAIFCEHDNLDKTTQLNLWRELQLPEPTFQVDTGGKSIHSYWVLDEPVAIAQWRQLQSNLLDFTDADRSIKNPSRVMRLAGAWHSSGKQSLIVSVSEKKYTFEELRAAIPAPQKVEAGNVSTFKASDYPGFPLQQFLTRDDRGVIDSGVTSRRNENGAKLARNLLGTAARLDYLGLKYTPSPRELFDDYCRRCIRGNGWNEREWDSIWKSAQKSNPTASLTDDALENCAKAWLHNQQKQANGNYNNRQSAKVITHPNFAPDIKDIGADIDSLIAQDLRRSQLLIAISELAQKYKMAENAIQKIYNTRVEELEREDARGDVKAEIESLLAAQKSSIELSEIFPEKLAKPIERLASILNLKPECFAIALLTQASALMKVGTETMLYPQSDYYCTPNYFGAIVAEVSQKKSPILRAMISRPMLPLLRAAREEYKEKLEEYELKLVEWKANKKERNGPEPIKPRKRVYSFSKATGESIPYQVEHFPYQPLMYRCDELAGLLKSSNQYRGGKGSDDEDLLEYWNGGSTGTGVLRSEGMKADLDNILLSIFGTIQPSILANFLSQGDGNGKFARFDFVVQPLAACELSMDMPNVDLTPMLSDLYWRIDSLPAVKFELSLEARRKFIAFYNNCEQRRVQEQDPAIAGMIGKMPEKVGKLATCIHTIHSLFDGSELPTIIEPEAVVAAINFVRFTELQVRSLRSEIGDRRELAPNLVRMIQILARKGAATIRDIITGFSSRCRPTSSTVRQWFSELVQLGYCVPVENGKFKLSENCGSSGSFGSNPVPASDRAWIKSGANDPDLDHQPEKMIQMIQNDPGVDHIQTITQHSFQPNDPDDPQKKQNQKNAIDESVDSVTVADKKTASNVTEAIAQPQPGNEVISESGTVIATVSRITKTFIWLSPLVDRELCGKLKDGLWVASHKQFKEWAELKRVKFQAAIPSEPNWQPGQKLKLRVNGQMQRDVVEFIGYHFTLEGVAMAIVERMGGQHFVPFDRLSEVR